MGAKSYFFAFVLALVAALVQFYLSYESESRYMFQTEWFDPISGTVKKFHMSFFPLDKSVEMYDVGARKIFLKRLPVDGIEERDLYLGNTVVVLSRHLKIIDYVDEKTKNIISNKRQRTFAMIKPDAVHSLGQVIDLIQSRDFEFSNMKMVHLSRDQAAEFYQEHKGRSFFESEIVTWLSRVQFNDFFNSRIGLLSALTPLLDYITSGPVVALELITSNAVQKWRDTLGPTDSQVARQDAPESLRAKFGKDKQENAAHGSDSDSSASREIEFFFPLSFDLKLDAPKATAKFMDNTCCIIKPHAITSGKMGSIITAIQKEGYEITALKMVRLDKIQTEEFLEVYKGVVNEYPGMVHQLLSGPLVAVEISHGLDTPQLFREFVGPADPILAKELRPKSLRARFGEDKVRNAVHCSDLPEDGPLEVEYFFKILSDTN